MSGARKVLMAPELMDEWASRTVDGDLLSWDWGEPDADGFYTPAITRHTDDNLVRPLLDDYEALRSAAAALIKDHSYWLNPSATAALRAVLTDPATPLDRETT